MTTFELPATEGKPVNIVDFKLALQLSPPEIKERIIDTVDHYVSSQTETLRIDYNDAPTEEGYLNIYICRFKSGKYRLHIFGRIKGKVLRAEREISEVSTNSLGIVNERIKYVLVSSRNILRNYYLNANLKRIEDHLMAFLLPL